MLKINGQTVHSLAHLAQAITAVEKEAASSTSTSSSSSGSSSGSRQYLRLDLEWSKVVVMDVGRAAAATGRILRQNNIPAAASHGLMDQVGGQQVLAMGCLPVCTHVGSECPLLVGGATLCCQALAVRVSPTQ